MKPKNLPKSQCLCGFAGIVDSVEIVDFDVRNMLPGYL